MKFLLLNQTFHPDVAATAQYLADVARGLVGRGHEVTVLASRRAYDDPELLFPKREVWRGARVMRVGSTGFGKGAKWRRAADFASFLAFCSLRLAAMRRFDAVLALTSPPLISVLAAWAARLRGARFYYWVMDFNPDEAIAAGWLRSGSLAARVLEGMSRFSLRRADRIIALDRFMRDRIAAKGIAPDKIAVLAPWSHDEVIHFDAAGRERFRAAHGLQDKFVVMYSGNHSPCHPLDTVLAAARRLAADPEIVFCFVGGGSEWRKIKETAGRTGDGGARLICLPYQPLSELSASLSAADLHLVVMGEPFVGLVHPCKIYNILRVGAPILHLGPEPSHISEILAELGSGHPSRFARHGDVEGVVRAIRELKTTNTRRNVPALPPRFSRETGLPSLLDILQGGAQTPRTSKSTGELPKPGEFGSGQSKDAAACATKLPGV